MKEYEVKSLEDLCDLVDAKNVEVLAEDLKNWLISYHVTIDAIREQLPESMQSKKNSEIAKSSFTWIDDGKNHLKGVSIDLGKGKKHIKLF
jgi:hypothetical protein